MSLAEGIRIYAQRHGGLVRLGLPDVDPVTEMRALGYEASEQRLKDLLGDLTRSGEIQRPSRGIYLVPDAFGRISRWAVASELGGPDAYISLWSAADFHGLTTSQVGWLSVVTDRDAQTLDLGDLGSAVFHKTDRARLFGFAETADAGVYARIARPERLLIDLLWFADANDAPGAIESRAIWEAASKMPLNGSLLVEYTRRMASARLTRRVGYLMDHFGLVGSEQLLSLRGTEKQAIPAIPGRGSVSLGRSTKWGISD